MFDSRIIDDRAGALALEYETVSVSLAGPGTAVLSGYDDGRKRRVEIWGHQHGAVCGRHRHPGELLPMIATIPITAVAAAHELASVIELGGQIELTLGDASARVIQRAGNDFVEIRFVHHGGRWLGVNVTLERPNPMNLRTRITHSSSSSRGTAEDTKATVTILRFVVEVAEILDGWAAQKGSRLEKEMAR